VEKAEKFFTGIGSRETPQEALRVLHRLSAYLVKKGFKLRSGHAYGADRACEEGADGSAVIYLPWKGFGQKPYKEDPGARVVGLWVVPPLLRLPKDYLNVIKWVCEERGSSYDDMSQGIQKLLYRNVCQVLGHGPEFHPSEVVICYHEDTGGTMYAVDIAILYNVPVLNVRGLDYYEAKKKLKYILKNKGASGGKKRKRKVQKKKRKKVRKKKG